MSRDMNNMTITGTIEGPINRKDKEKSSYVSFKIKNHSVTSHSTITYDFNIFVVDKVNVDYAVKNLKEGDRVLVTGQLTYKDYKGKNMYSIVNSFNHTLLKLNESSSSKGNNDNMPEDDLEDYPF